MKKFRELDKYIELSPIRDHIKLEFTEVEKDAELKAVIQDIGENLKPEFSRAIIFCTSRKLTEESAEKVNKFFRKNEKLVEKAAFYHAGMDADSREKAFDSYMKGSTVILFATKAFGMGMDIPNIHHVYHIGPSSSFEDYLQEVGRAGRNPKDLEIAGYSTDNPIKAICFHTKDSFPKFRDWMQKIQVSWNDLCNVFEVYKEYRSQFVSDNENREQKEFFPVPLNIISTSNKYENSEMNLNSLFRLSLYWLERANRINSRYYVPAFLEFENTGSLDKDRSEQILDNNIRSLYTLVYLTKEESYKDASSTLVEGAFLMRELKLNREELFKLILKAQKSDVLRLVNKININTTNYVAHDQLLEEQNYEGTFQFLKASLSTSNKLLELINVFEKVEILNDNLDQIIHVISDEMLFEDFLNKAGFSGSDLEMAQIYLKVQRLADATEEKLEFKEWLNKLRKDDKSFALLREQRKILKSQKSSQILKAAFFMLNLHPKVSIVSGFSEESKIITQKVKIEIEKKDLKIFLQKLTADAQKVINQLSMEKSRIIDVNDFILKLSLDDPNYTYVENLLFLLRKLGYVRFSGGLVPMAIEMKFKELTALNNIGTDIELNKEYVETIRMKKLRLIVLECFSELKEKEKQKGLIKDYFNSKNSKEIITLIENYSKKAEVILGPYRAEALKERVKGLNEDQKAVYDADIRSNVSVLAGPGTGKTHTLVLRVARLIQHENIPPNKILILAYNRSVVEELKLRLKDLFTKLGYKSLINSLQVYTFAGLVGSIIKQNGIAEVEIKKWETTFLDLYKKKGRRILGRFSDVEYVFIDEFQDITLCRLEILKKVAAKERTYITAIGDPNQSIYGFEREDDSCNLGKGPIAAEYYYDLFNQEYHPAIQQLTINYRSTPEIIEASKSVLSQNATLIDFNANPQGEFFGEVEIVEDTDLSLEKLLEFVKNKSNHEVAILFRSNEELYKDFGLIRALVEPEGFKVEIKGSSSSFTRKREIAYVLDTIRNKRIGATIDHRDGIRKYIDRKVKVKYPLWNNDLLDDFANLFEYYYDQYNEESLYGDFIEFVEDITAKDDGQLFKILKNQKKDIVRTVILTTIHRVKGMEYQNVIVPSSIAKLPFEPRERNYTSEELEELIDEEKRLRYVAFSRAQKNLFAEIGERERCIQNYSQFIPDAGVSGRGIPVKNGDKITMISWKAKNGDYFKKLHALIHNELETGQRVHIGQDNNANYGVFHNGQMLEKFSNQFANRFSETKYHGIYVDSITRYTVEDCRRYDENNRTTFLNSWSQEAISRGYVYIINFFGYAVPATEWIRNQREILEKIRINASVNTLQ